MRRSIRMTFCILVAIAIVCQATTITSASPEDLYWGIQEGEKIHYRYQGRYFHHEDDWIEVSLDEEMYFEIIDITGIPYPLQTSTSPISIPYWANDTSFEEQLMSDPFWSNVELFGPVALKLGNWTYVEAITQDILEVAFHPQYHNIIGWVNETSTMWNFTTYQYWDLGGTFELRAIWVRQYSKSDGVLDYGWGGWYASNPSDMVYIELTRIHETPYSSVAPIVLIGGVIIVIVFVVIWKRRK